MKKSLSLAVLILIFFFASTQDSDAQFRLKLGPYTGMNFNLGTGSDLQETMTGFSFFFGSQVEMGFTPTIGMITQLQFYDNRSGGTSETGTFQTQQGNVTGTLDSDISLAYFMIQPLLKLTLPSSNFYFLVGPSIGFNIEASQAYTLTPQAQQGQQQQQPIKGKSSIKDTNVRFELTTGAGYDIPLSSLLVLTPQFTFGFGITTIIKDFSARIMTFQLGTALKFKLI